MLCFVSHALALHGDVLRAKVLLCSERVVSLAAQRELIDFVLTAQREGVQVMDRQKVRLATALSALIHEGARSAVAVEHSAPDRCWNVAGARALLDPTRFCGFVRSVKGVNRASSPGCRVAASRRLVLIGVCSSQFRMGG